MIKDELYKWIDSHTSEDNIFTGSASDLKQYIDNCLLISDEHGCREFIRNIKAEYAMLEQLMKNLKANNDELNRTISNLNYYSKETHDGANSYDDDV